MNTDSLDNPLTQIDHVRIVHFQMVKTYTIYNSDRQMDVSIINQ